MAELARALSKKTVAALLVKSGYSLAEESALDALAEVQQEYLESMGSRAREYADAAGRTGVLLEDMRAAWRDRHPASAEEELRSRSVAKGEECHLPHEVPSFPAAADGETAVKRRRLAGSMAPLDGSAGSRPSNAPDFMPPLPAPHTYLRTEIPAIARPSDPKAVVQAQLRQNRKVEASLCNLRGTNIRQLAREKVAVVLQISKGDPSSEDFAAAGRGESVVNLFAAAASAD